MIDSFQRFRASLADQMQNADPNRDAHAPNRNQNRSREGRDDDHESLERTARELTLLAGAIGNGCLPLTPGRTRRIRETLDQLDTRIDSDAAPRLLLRDLTAARQTLEHFLGEVHDDGTHAERSGETASPRLCLG